MTTTVHTVNHTGSDEFSIHVLGRREQPEVVAIFTKGDKRENRANALKAARQLAFELRCKVAMNHGISARRFDEFLPKDCR
jgi:methionyl-tRNA formyltransferase